AAGMTAEDAEVLELAAASDRPWIWVVSKRDLTGPCALWSADKGGHAPAAMVSLSAETGEGLDELEQAVAALFPQDEAAEAGAMLTNARQAEAAGRARSALERGAQALTAGLSPDAVVADVEEAMSALGELTGRTVREDVTARIFERFCVGK
ncbi:MAG: tRNA uridine-5-carboxymethylaminomethyl(34) synthesis GTPase MnmE, partial [Oscillospiraceae bacterium]|nr:tRNA uridine-5-carboxymethylaminomethyl(34) synthesis GTPase MnmE [Oscillospiraceae bacterium]